MSPLSHPVVMDASNPYRRLKFLSNVSKRTPGVEVTSGIFEPSELAELREVFEEITAQPWFGRDPDARKAFGRYLFKNCRDGSPTKHRLAVEHAARQYFSNQPPESR